MARVQRKPKVEEPAALVAAGRRVVVSSSPASAVKAASNGSGWQGEAWRHYFICGEFRQAVNWVANTCSRAVLMVTRDTGAGPVPVEENDPADDLLDQFGVNAKGKTLIIKNMALHYSVAGECWVVGQRQPGDERTDDVWQWGVYAYDAVKQQGGKYTLLKQVLPDDAVVIHSWIPNPLNPNKADSPTRAALPILAEIERLTQHVAAQVDSRLTSAGVMFFSNKMAVSATGVRAEDGTPVGTTAIGATPQQFVDAFTATAEVALADHSDPAARIPIAVTGEPEDIEAFRYETFWSELDEQSIALRAEAIRRLALSMDMPPEILTGTGDANHWSAWQVDESAIKSHTEPLLGQITADLTEGYLIPALLGADGDAPLVDRPQEYAIDADTSEMRLRPNRSQEAMELYDRGELSGRALLRETGFDEADAMGDEERSRWLLMKAAQGSTTPEIVAEAMRMLGVPLPEIAVPEAIPTEERPAPSLEDHPTRDLPDEPSAALIAASEQMVYRALERAGNRIRNRTRYAPDGVAAAEIYLFTERMDAELADHALDDAWSHVGRFAGDLGVNELVLTDTLNRYTRALLLSNRPYEKADLVKHLRVLS